MKNKIKMFWLFLYAAFGITLGVSLVAQALAGFVLTPGAPAILSIILTAAVLFFFGWSSVLSFQILRKKIKLDNQGILL